MRQLTPEQIEFLVEKKLRGTILPEEQVLLDQWFNQKTEEHMVWYSDDPDEKALRQRLLKRIQEDTALSGHQDAIHRMQVWRRYRWSAAAILLLIAGYLGYLFIFDKNAAPIELAVEQKPAVQDIVPGHKGAILTLANGRKIVLDSAGNGHIAVQGGQQLVKQNGQLLYEKDAGESSSKYGEANGMDLYNTMTTPRGREFQLVLSDGTRVWLNAASSITFPTAFSGKERKVNITGEAYFEVAQDSRHPFIVSAGAASITVLGTHFNVMAYADENGVKTTLLEGLVRVSGGDQQVTIKPGQQASFSARSERIRVTAVDASQSIDWVEGKLSLDNLDVAAIMRKISRWYNVDVEFKGPVSQAHFWGLINREVNLSEMLKVMQANGINVRLENNKIIVSGN